MKFFNRLGLSAISFLAISSNTLAQISWDLDLGLRGGVFNSGIPISVENNHYFPDIYTADNLSFTTGPTIGFFLKDRWQIRFEAVRSQFRFHRQFGTNGCFPYCGTESNSITDGHVWQYPLLLTYVTTSGPIRPFAGGGLSFGSRFRGITRTETTTVVGPLPARGSNAPFNTVTTTSTAPFKPDGVIVNGQAFPFYITGGLESRLSMLSIRPELRYTHWTNFDPRSDGGYQDDTILFSANQFEFLVSVTIHPFPHRRSDRVK